MKQTNNVLNSLEAAGYRNALKNKKQQALEKRLSVMERQISKLSGKIARIEKAVKGK